MPTYTYPEMPLSLAAWFNHGESPPTGPPDAIIAGSLSPLRPEDFFRGTTPAAAYPSTHIIRCEPGLPLSDNYWPRIDNATFPCTLWEYPQGSGHFYATVWAHEVGAGFPNHHARAYVLRWVFEQNPPPPIFQGWI